MVSLKNNGNHFCSGTFVSDKHVLTAGQCVETIRLFQKPNFNPIAVVLGLTPYKILQTDINPKYDLQNPIKTFSYNVGIILVSLLINEY